MIMGLLEFVDGVINFVGTVAVLPAMAISDAIMLIATLFAPVSSKLIYQENLWGLPPQKKNRNPCHRNNQQTNDC